VVFKIRTARAASCHVSYATTEMIAAQNLSIWYIIELDIKINKSLTGSLMKTQHIKYKYRKMVWRLRNEKKVRKKKLTKK
jgi:hypothetical protein